MSDGTQITLACIGSFTTLALQAFSFFSRKLDRVKDKVVREQLAEKVETARVEIAAKVDEHNKAMVEKLDTNTQLTVQGVASASQAYEEANHFGERLKDIEEHITDRVELELGRLSRNIHSIANALTPFLGHAIEMEPRPGDPEEKT